jgi:hypothetical protein
MLEDGEIEGARTGNTDVWRIPLRGDPDVPPPPVEATTPPPPTEPTPRPAPEPPNEDRGSADEALEEARQPAKLPRGDDAKISGRSLPRSPRNPGGSRRSRRRGLWGYPRGPSAGKSSAAILTLNRKVKGWSGREEFPWTASRPSGTRGSGGRNLRGTTASRPIPRRSPPKAPETLSAPSRTGSWRRRGGRRRPGCAWSSQRGPSPHWRRSSRRSAAGARRPRRRGRGRRGSSRSCAAAWSPSAPARPTAHAVPCAGPERAMATRSPSLCPRSTAGRETLARCALYFLGYVAAFGSQNGTVL